MSSDIAIKVDGLGKCYQIYDKPRDRLLQMIARSRRRYFREFWALRDITFEVARGEAVGIVGRNGCGKSTLLQMICGTLNPSSGSVESNGRIAALLELGSGFNPDFTGRENVFLNGAILGLTRDEIEERFDQIAEFAGIDGFIDQPVKTYSSGMMLRLAFAVSVGVGPEILVIDEALAVGDIAFQFKCLERLRELTERGTTLLLVSHDIGVIKNFCSRAIYLADGRERCRGTPDDVTERYLMDLRQTQNHGVAGTAEVRPKPFLGIGSGIAFGTGQGHIRAARFSRSGTTHAGFAIGESIGIEVEAEYETGFAHPAVMVIVQDRRGLALGGQVFPLVDAEVGAGGLVRARLSVTMQGRLAGGRYSITLRLEDRVSAEVPVLIDKQSSVLTMELSGATSDFVGPVDLGLYAA